MIVTLYIQICISPVSRTILVPKDFETSGSIKVFLVALQKWVSFARSKSVHKIILESDSANFEKSAKELNESQNDIRG